MEAMIGFKPFTNTLDFSMIVYIRNFKHEFSLLSLLKVIIFHNCVFYIAYQYSTMINNNTTTIMMTTMTKDNKNKYIITNVNKSVYRKEENIQMKIYAVQNIFFFI